MNLPPQMKDLIKAAADAHDLPFDLVAAICYVESAFNSNAIRFEPGWRWFLSPKTWSRRVKTTERTERVGQAISWGLMQVMGTVARERGFKGAFPELCRPEIGLEYGCRHLVWNIQRWGLTWDAIMAYNAGRPGTKAGLRYLDKVNRIQARIFAA